VGAAWSCGTRRSGAQQWRCLPCRWPCLQPGQGLAAAGTGSVADTAGLAAGDAGAGSGVARDGDRTAIARGSGDEAGAAPGVAAVLASSLRPAPGTVPGPPAARWPDVSSANATAAPISTSAVADAVMAARKLVSSSQELIESRSRARPAGRARPAR
jgi:hypothetical protein